MVFGLLLALALSFQDPTWTEHKLATVPLEVIVRNSGTVFSDDGSSVFWAGKSEKTGKASIWTDQKPGEEFDNVQSQVVSGNGKTLAYMAFRGKAVFMVAGDRHDPVFPAITQAYVSPDGSVVAYRAHTAAGEVMVINGKAGRPYDKVHTPAFNPKTNEVAYVTALKDKASVVIGEREIAVHDEAYFPRWRPDGAVLAYGAKDGKSAFVVVGQKKSKSYNSVSGPKFAPDGTTVTFTATEGEKSMVVVGEREHGPYVNAFAYVVDARLEVAAVAFGRKSDHRILWKGQAGPRFDGILSLWMDAQSRPVFEPAIAPDDSTFAFRGERDGKWHVIVGDQEGPAFKQIGLPVFSADSRSVAYQAADGAEAVLIVVNGQRLGPYSFTGPPRLSTDGRKVAFGARVGSEFWWKVVDLPQPR